MIKSADFHGSCNGKKYEESGAKPWDLTDQQKEFVTKDKVRHVLVMGLESTETVVRWNNKMQAAAESDGFDHAYIDNIGVYPQSEDCIDEMAEFVLSHCRK